MRKASRLFEIIQILRLADHPITAQQIAEKLEDAEEYVHDAKAEVRLLEEVVDEERDNVNRLLAEIAELKNQGVLNASAR